ncbi:MAG: hypothetical protein QF441_08985 [Bacteriovoracaceae bacterium]|jgi:hypothetical protein|nr:hypothetical protein [Halobacteriovoraceae bacterium]MDP7320728.1 hypothetical protein [Bacteriovoracaceae bacterium]
MRYSLKDIFLGVFKTAILLVFLEIFCSAILPAFGILEFKPAFNVLIILFLAFKLEAPFLPFLILFFQYIHSAFSVEGWASGTLAGVIIAMSVKYVKDMLNFSTAISTIVVVQIFQIAWFILIAFILSLKLGDFSNFFSIFIKYLPESFFLSLISHHFFKLLDNFWKVGKSSHGVRY